MQKRRLSIRARLIILALLILVPLMLDRVRLLEGTRTERIETAHAEVLDIARRGIDTQVEIVNATRAVLQTIARAYIALVKPGQSCDAFVEMFKPEAPWLLSLSVVGSDGRVACSTRKSAIGVDVSDRDYVKSARMSWNFALSDYIVHRTTLEPTVMAAQPTMTYDESSNAIIISSVDLQWIGRLTTKIGQRTGATVFLIDSAGTLIAGQAGRDVQQGRNHADHPFAKMMMANAGGTFATKGLDGVRRIFAVRQLPGTEARLVVGLDEREVLSRIDREIGIAYLQLVLFGLIVLLAAWFGGEQLIVEPIRKLVRVASRIGHGEVGSQLGRETWAVEFAPLATALDDMAQRLDTRERDLRSANEHLEELASIDGLSGLANRRSFDARLEAEWQHARKVQRPIGLLMIDVDHFKLYNDNYGHLAGDACLRTVGDTITAMAKRTADFPARFGGEEFAMLLPDVSVQKALEIAETVRQAVEALAIANLGATGGIVTVSVGVACVVPSALDTPDMLIETADAGLYSAKRRGRNAVVAHAPVELLEAG